MGIIYKKSKTKMLHTDMLYNKTNMLIAQN